LVEFTDVEPTGAEGQMYIFSNVYLQIVSFIVLFFFFSAGDRTQGLALARQVLFHSAKSPPFMIFEE
jgi:hypothetical protein